MTTSVTNLEQADISIYPNPFDQVLNLQIESEQSLEVSIYNLQGQKMYASKLNGGFESLSTNDWPTGMYLIRALNETGQLLFSEKLVK